MKNLFLVSVFCILLTESHGAETTVSDQNLEEKSQGVDYWYMEVGPKDL